MSTAAAPEAASEAAAATKKDASEEENKGEEDHSIVTQSFPPSHILQDGRFIYLPPPNEFERNRFFERSVAKYGLMDADMATTKEDENKEEDEEEEDKKKKDDSTPKVHPLAVASARLQTGGIAELNRAINLSMLVNTGEYFGLTNVVDPAVELLTAGGAVPATPSKPAEGDAAKKTDGATPAPAATPAPTAAAAAVATPTPAAQKAAQEEQRIKNAYVLKRKRVVFDKASRVLTRHQTRLEAAVAAQAVPDQRLRQLRTQWRLVAPEHGTRAKSHAVRPTEVVAIDVDVYDPTGGSGGIGSSLAGRLAAQVPRYATVELTEEYNNQQDDSKEEEEEDNDEEKASKKIKSEDDDKEDAMEVDEPVKKEEVEEEESDERKYCRFTMAEPFAIADPTMGKISTDFDPNKVTFLTLQFDIEKPSTGFHISCCLEPMTTTTIEKLKEEEKNKQDAEVKKEEGAVEVKKEEGADESKAEDKDQKKGSEHALPDDEQVLVSLQHSLFCAKLFEAIRKEIMGEDHDEDESAASKQQNAAHKQQEAQSHHSVMWLYSEQEENFLPPPSVMVRPSTTSGAPLCVVHCHASEVNVQLDSEYTLRAKLVEAADKSKEASQNAASASLPSGSNSSAQLLVLCRSLLLHAQEAYHKHSLLESIDAAEKQREEEAKRLEINKPRGLDRIQKKDVRKQPKILQSVVGLGTKMLFEQRIRKVLVRVRHWLKKRYPSCQDTLKSEWLSLSLFDPHTRFTLSFGLSLTVDVTMVRDEMTIITTDTSSAPSEGTSGAYRKVHFHSDSEFEIFLKMEVRRQMKRKAPQQQQLAMGGAAAPIIVQ